MECNGEEYKQILQSFRRICRAIGIVDFEDVAHSYILARLEGKANLQRYHQFAIDYLRRAIGRTGTYKAKANQKTFHSEMNELGTSYEVDIEGKIFVAEMMCRIPSDRNRAIFLMHNQLNLGTSDIARMFGITQGRVSQIISQAVRKMKNPKRKNV